MLCHGMLCPSASIPSGILSMDQITRPSPSKDENKIERRSNGLEDVSGHSSIPTPIPSSPHSPHAPQKPQSQYSTEHR
ncbi:hypothetical protein BU24DRAFT_419544, partial [Aaosphaeria arxii CBS 175.79]